MYQCFMLVGVNKVSGFTLKLKRQQPLLGKQVFVVVFSDKQKIVKMRRKKIDVVPAIHADLLLWHRSALI